MKERKKGDYDYDKFALKGSEPANSHELGLEGNASTHWTTPVNAENLSWKEIYIPPLWWLTAFMDDFLFCFLFFVFFSFNFRVDLNL